MTIAILAHDSRKELENEQEEVNHTSHNRHPVNTPLTCDACFVQSLHFHLFSCLIVAKIVHKSVTYSRSSIIFRSGSNISGAD